MVASPAQLQYPLTKQAIIDRQWDWFFQCGNPEGWDEEREECRYDVPCAIGILIPDGMSLREEHGASLLLRKDVEFGKLFQLEVTATTLEDLQEAHDEAAKQANCDENTAIGSFHILFYQHLKHLAQEWNCKLPKPTAGWDYGNRLPAVGQR